jgi:hypothetical protein
MTVDEKRSAVWRDVAHGLSALAGVCPASAAKAVHQFGGSSGTQVVPFPNPPCAEDR